MSANGEDKKESVDQQTGVPEEGKPKLAVEIYILPDGQCELKTSMIAPMVVWMFMQLIFLLIAKNLGYAPKQENKIVQPTGGIMNFAKRFKH